MTKVKSQAPRASTRRRHTNSKLGCLNCKRKKIRCNESLPICGNCAKGKKETCSYLSLDQQEIDRIRLTHSLRDSQNKLLNLNYRLPTSSNKDSHKFKKVSPVTSATALEFKFELMKLPLRIPTFAYPPLQFNNLSMNNFSNEFRVINDFDTSDDSGSSPQSIVENRMLLGGFVQPTSFTKLDFKSKVVWGSSPYKNKLRAPLQLDINIFTGMESVADHLRSFIMSINSNSPHTDVLFNTFVCLGRTIILTYFQHIKQYDSHYQWLQNYIPSFELRCLESHALALAKLRRAISHFHSIEATKENAEEIEYYTTMLGYCYSYLTAVTFMFKFESDRYFNSSRGAFTVFQIYFKFTNDHNLEPSPLFKFLLKNIRINILSVNIPSYNPHFFYELNDNFKLLGFIFQNQNIKFEDPELSKSYDRVCYRYKTLLTYLEEEILPHMILKRNEKFVSTYPPEVIFGGLKKWLSNFPSETITFRPICNSEYPEECAFINDLSTTLYLYYYSIASALDSVFPASKYLFGISFQVPVNCHFFDRNITTIQKENTYHQKLFDRRIDNLLQRHIYFSLRLFSFFRRRHNFYQDHLTWSNPFTEQLRDDRFASRSVKDSFETPIKSFNTTLIRPEHYPTKRSELENSTFTRTDDTMVQKMYTRNIETLDFFNEGSILHFDYETLLLLQDYRPISENSESSVQIDGKILREYFEDKTIILSSLH